jgi:fimbrial chaperone protein
MLARNSFAIALALAGAGSAHASALQVSPVIVQVALPAAASSLRLRNLGSDRITAQLRVYRWSQEDGADQLVETRNVVASPPFVTIGAQTSQVVRIVRVAGHTTPPAEESYRLLIDEIPERPGTPGKGINFAVRYSLPVFFTGADLRSAPLQWTVESRADRLDVMATNPGTRHVRVAALRVTGPRGQTVAFGDGLIGYVLGGSTARWSVKGSLGGMTAGGTLAISANTQHGPLQATGTIRKPR